MNSGTNSPPNSTTTPPRSILLQTIPKILRTPPRRDAGAWADEHRRLPSSNAEPGRWRTARVPYTRAIYEAVESRQYREVVAIMASQSSKTETVLNVIGKRLTDGPFMPVLYVGPTETFVRSFSNDRIRNLVNSTPLLSERLERGHRDKVTEKYFGGVRLGLAWAGSATMLSSHPVGLLLVDELDRFEGDVQGEGDPYLVAKARGETFRNFKAVAITSPTTAEASRSWHLFHAGTMNRWAWPCESCGEYFVLCLDRLQIPDDADPDTAADEARIVCEHCDHVMTDAYRLKGNAEGKYLPHDYDHESGEYIRRDAPRVSQIASFHVSGLASPFRSIGDRARELVQARASGSPLQYQAVLNTRFGEWYRPEAESIDPLDVAELVDDYEPGTIPHGVQLITGAIDVQKNGLYYIIRGWGADSESWLIEHGFLPGETELDSVWIVAQRLCAKTIEGRKVNRWMVDAGYRPTGDKKIATNKVKEFALRMQGLVSPCFGRARIQDTPITGSRMKVDRGRQTLRTAVIQYKWDSDVMKTWVYSRIHLDERATGRFHLHRDTGRDYMRQLASERLVIEPNGKRTWHLKPGFENHYLDCEAMARVAALIEGVDKILVTERQAAARVAAPMHAPAAPAVDPYHREKKKNKRGRKSANLGL